MGALLFKIEAAVRVGYTKKACTDEACRWNVDFVEHIKGEPLHKIKIYGDEAIKNFNGKKGTNGQKVMSSYEKQKRLLDTLASCKEKPITLHCFSSYYEDFKPQFVPPARGRIPPSLRNLYMQEPIGNIDEKCLQIFNNMKLSDEDISYIYDATKKQSNCLAWYEVRIGRLTASIAHDVLHTNMENPSRSLLRKICNPSTLFNVAALEWGKAKEKEALNELAFQMSGEHDSFEIKECGLRLCKDTSFIGASPDGIFLCKCHNTTTLIEIKCPHSLRATKSVENVDKKKFFMDEQNHLKQSHKYYAQVQLQLYVFGYKECIFFVWTPNWSIMCTVERNEDFISSMIKTLSSFYLKHVIPELLTRCIENGEDKENAVVANKLYCICQSIYDGEEQWIGCDSTNCKYEWFHFKCAKVKRPPKGNWYCSECKKQRNKK